MVNFTPGWVRTENGDRTGWSLSEHVAPAAGKLSGYLLGHRKGVLLRAFGQMKGLR